MPLVCYLLMHQLKLIVNCEELILWNTMETSSEELIDVNAVRTVTQRNVTYLRFCG